jgi:hypothetical protein
MLSTLATLNWGFFLAIHVTPKKKKKKQTNKKQKKKNKQTNKQNPQALPTF